jgi:hypothetical protein
VKQPFSNKVSIQILQKMILSATGLSDETGFPTVGFWKKTANGLWEVWRKTDLEIPGE